MAHHITFTLLTITMPPGALVMAALRWRTMLVVSLLTLAACSQAAPTPGVQATVDAAIGATAAATTPTPAPSQNIPAAAAPRETLQPSSVPDGNPFTSGSPESQGCLKDALGDEAFQAIAENRRPPTAAENPLIGSCFAGFGGPPWTAPGGPPPGDATEGAQPTLWSATSSVQIPDASRISVSFEPGAVLGRAMVTGGSGAVSPREEITVVAHELGLPTSVVADAEGAFQAEIDAIPGSHVFIYGENDGAGSGVLLPIAPGPTAVGASRVRPGHGGAPWIVTGSIQDRALQPGQSVSLSGRVVLPIPLDAAPPPAGLTILGVLISDATGQQVGLGAEFVSAFLTQTGLPVARRFMYRTEDRKIAGPVPLLWRIKGDFWGADFATTATIPETFAPGLYQLTALLQLDGSLDFKGEPIEGQFTTAPTGCCEASLGNFTVGAAAPTRLAATILADVLDQGSRGGVRAAQDEGAFDISSRVATRHDPVVARLDGFGRPWTYRLEPYLPMLGAVDREPPAVPPILFDFSSSELTVTVARPDGRTDRLGPAPLSHHGFRVPSVPTDCFREGGISTGGHLSGLIQLQSAPGIFSYEFPMDGDYIVNLSGRVADYGGRMYEISGDYKVTVANSLKISPTLLPGTPFEVSDSLAPALLVTPAVPADVTYTITHAAADGSITRQVFTGSANRHGWWDGDGDTLTFSTEGEYRIDIEARHETAEGALWAGRMRFGGVVASPNSPIVLHGRRGGEGGGFHANSLPPPWFLQTDFDPDPEHQGHLFAPFFGGDIQWGVTDRIGDAAISFRTSIQLRNTDHSLVERAKEQFLQFGEPLNDHLSMEQLVSAGQVTLGTFQDAGSGLSGMHPGDIGLWAYVYTSAQRPEVRVREYIEGGEVGSAYWGFNDAFHMQSGNGPEGDLPGEFKFLYAGAVVRDDASGEGLYAIYGSGWVLTPDEDPRHARVFPPFQGAAGGPSGGPLFTVHGREIEMFFLPLAVRPGAMLEVGDVFRMAGPIMPTLPSLVSYTVSAPDGTVRTFQGRANAIGYYYEPGHDFKVDQPGLWTVRLTVTHDGMTSAGPVEEPLPTGSVLSPDGATYTFVVTDSESGRLAIQTDLENVPPSSWYCHRIQQAYFQAAVPASMEIERAHVTVTMPGTVLVDEDVEVDSWGIRWELDAQVLNTLASNFDFNPGIADTVTVTFSVEGTIDGKPAHRAGSIVTHGSRLAGASTNRTASTGAG